jgi:AhpD family alkylhydroperoxidase
MEVKQIMNARVDLMHTAPSIIQAMLGLERQVRQAGLEGKLLDLVRMRASQINGCAYCLDMHSKDARANGETEQRLYGLEAWRETPYYAARERAALEWTEALTLVSETHVPDDVYERVREQFSEDELAHLSLAVVAINGWNRLNIAARTVPGDYVPATHAQVHATRLSRSRAGLQPSPRAPARRGRVRHVIDRGRGDLGVQVASVWAPARR